MRKLLVIIQTLVVCTAASAQGITLDRCRQMAREHYPEVARYDLIKESEQFELTNAEKNWIPQITLGAQATWQNAVASFPEYFTKMMESMGMEYPGIAKDQYRVALDVRQTIWDGGMSKANKQIVESEAEERMLSTDVDLYALESRIDGLFFGILILDENYGTALSRMELLDANLAKLESMGRNGVAMSSDIALVKAKKLTLLQNIDQNRSARASYVGMLSLFTGADLSEETFIKPERSEVLLMENSRPELRLIDSQIAGLNAREKLIDARLTPVFSFFAQTYYGNPGLDMFKAMTSRDWTFNAYLGVRMQWEISGFFTRKNDMRRINNSRKMLGVGRDIFLFNTGIQSREENGDVARLKKALASDDEIVGLRTEIRRTAESQRSNGVIDTATLLERIDEESEAKVSRNIHEIELLKKMYELKHTLGQ